MRCQEQRGDQAGEEGKKTFLGGEGKNSVPSWVYREKNERDNAVRKKRASNYFVPEEEGSGS